MDEPFVERRPSPDPTTLTLAALQREVSTLSDLIEAKLLGHWNLDEQRFKAVDQRFVEREQRFIQVATAHSNAITAALASTNAATVRIEASFSKQIQQISAADTAAINASNERFADLKDRVAALEGLKEGQTTIVAWVIAALGVGVAAFGAIGGHLWR